MQTARTVKDKQLAVDRLAYEIRMLGRTAEFLSRKLKRKRAPVIHNALIQSFLLATRTLHEFFFRASGHTNNIYARDLIEDWDISPQLFEEGIHWDLVDEDMKGPGDKRFFDILTQRLHHITWPRVDESKLDWHEQVILRQLVEPIERLHATLAPELRTEYLDACVTEFTRTVARIEGQ